MCLLLHLLSLDNTRLRLRHRLVATPLASRVLVNSRTLPRISRLNLPSFFPNSHVGFPPTLQYYTIAIAPSTFSLFHKNSVMQTQGINLQYARSRLYLSCSKLGKRPEARQTQCLFSWLAVLNPDVPVAPTEHGQKAQTASWVVSFVAPTACGPPFSPGTKCG